MTIPKVGLTPSQPAEVSQSDDRRNPEIMRAAKMYENQFLREMVRAMRKTVPESDFMPESQAEKIFREQLDDQTVDNWTERGGVGMANVIYDQVVDHYFAHVQQKPSGPLPVTDRIGVQPIKKSPTSLEMQLQALDPNSREVLAPWNAKVISASSLGGGLSSLLLDHSQSDEKRLFSTLAFKGDLTAREGTFVEAGQRVGLLSSDNDKINWKIQK